MRCFYCKTFLIWQGEEPVELEEYETVTKFLCPECGACHIIYKRREPKK